MKKQWLVLWLFCVFLSGCGAQSHVIIPHQFNSNNKLGFSVSKEDGIEIPDEALEAIQNQIRDGLSAQNLLANNGNETFHKAEILITSYRMRPNAARLLVGIMAGCDNITSNVVVTDTRTKEKIGASEIVIKECAAWGVQSQVISAYSEGVVNYLAGKK